MKKLSVTSTSKESKAHKRGKPRGGPAAGANTATEESRALFSCYYPSLLLDSCSTLREAQSVASTGLDLAARELASVKLEGEASPFDIDQALFSTLGGVGDALRLFERMAVAKRIGCFPFQFLIGLRRLAEQLDSLIERVEADGKTRALADCVGKPEALKRAAFKGQGSRGLSMAAPRTRLVLRLWDKIEDVRVAWELFLKENPGLSRSEQQAHLHQMGETEREIIKLQPLRSGTALSYHRAGMRMLEDCARVARVRSLELLPAFSRAGEFAELASGSKSYAGALNAAWREVAKRLEHPATEAK